MSGNLSGDSVFYAPRNSDPRYVTEMKETVDWGVKAIGIPEIWKQTKGKGVRVAILDTGVALGHLDLKDGIEDAVDFTGSKSGPADGIGHGCVRKGTFIYSSYCGLERVEKLWERQQLLSSPIDVVGYREGKNVKAVATRFMKLRHKGLSYEVKLPGGEIILTPWHKVFVLEDFCRVVEKRTDELEVGDWLVHPNGSVWLGDRDWYIDGVFVDEELSWLLGFFLGDGSSSYKEIMGRNGVRVERQISFFSSEETLIKRCKEIVLKRFGEVKWSEDRDKRGCGVFRVAFYDKKVEDFFYKASGCRNAKVENIIVPDWLGKCKKSVALAFIGGFLDSDGHCGLDRSRFCFVTVSKDMAYSLSSLMSSLGVPVRLDTQKPNGRGKKICYYLDVRGVSVLRLKDLIKDYVFSSKKRERMLGFSIKKNSRRVIWFDRSFLKGGGVICGKVAVRVRGIRKFEDDEDYYDYEVPGVQNYLAGCGTLIFAHNTHVAGIVGARQNSFGVVGGAPECSLLIGKVVGDSGEGTNRMIANGILWAVEKKVNIISISLGSVNASDVVYEAVKAAFNAGIFIIAAAGNEGPSMDTVCYPALYSDECIAVGAVDRRLKIARYSSRGKPVDVVAPGDEILSTYPPNTYALLSGSSMATPLVTAVVALAFSKHHIHGGTTPIKTNKDLKGHLDKYAMDLGPEGVDPAYGFGLINPKALFEHMDEVGEVAVKGLALTINMSDLTKAGKLKVGKFIKGDFERANVVLLGRG